MSFIALEGAVTLFLPERVWKRCLLPFIAFAAGSLVGGAVLHMIPAAVDAMGNHTSVYCWLLAGFLLFYALEEFLNWHHSHTHSHSSPMNQQGQQQHPSHPTIGTDTQRCGANNCDRLPEETNIASEDTESNSPENNDCEDETIDVETGSSSNGSDQQQQHSTKATPITYLILVADAVHNLLGGMSVGASFVDSIPLGLSAWFAAVAHEIPQEIGDFATLVHGGWSKRNALLFNFISALTFPLGGLIAYGASQKIDVAFLIPFAAGNFLYIGASDLIPEERRADGEVLGRQAAVRAHL